MDYNSPPIIKNAIEFTQRKRTIVICSVILGIIVAATIGVSWYLWRQQPNPGQDGNDQTKVDAAAKGTLPSISNNPLENQPDINPAGNSNPVKDIKTNPFE